MPRGGKAEKAMVPEAEFRSYYDRAVLKEPVWKWYVPAYFVAGGAAGAAAALGAAAQVAGRRGYDGLVRRCRGGAAAGGGARTPLLLGAPGRAPTVVNKLPGV